MLKIAHIINPIIVGEASDLYAAQPVTFESMRLAQVHAEGSVAVELFSAQYREDYKLVPKWITPVKNLERSILDVGKFSKQRKLPLIKDILDRLYEASEADYFIYTNVDIGLMPYFYTAVEQLIDSGMDGMVINRRTVAKTPCEIQQLPLIWAQVGEKHPGFDCFVFRREAYPYFELGTACIGANWIGRVLLANVYAHARDFNVFKDLLLTFHLGDDRSWKIPEHLDFDLHNQNELLRILRNLKNEGKFEGRPMLWGFYQDALREPRKKLKNNRRRWWRM